MLKRSAVTISMFSNSTVLVGWCRARKRPRRRRSSTIRLGNKRRGFCLGSRPVVQWGVMVAPLRMLKKIIMDMAPNGRFVEAYYWSLPFLRPQIFPLCWYHLLWLFFFFFCTLLNWIRGINIPTNWKGKLLLVWHKYFKKCC